MTERQLQEAVVELAGHLGWRCYHTFDSRHSVAGFPDLVLVRPPRLLFVELKTASGRVAPAQEAWGRDLTAVAQATQAAIGYEQQALQEPFVWFALWRPCDWTSGRVEDELRRR